MSWPPGVYVKCFVVFWDAKPFLSELDFRTRPLQPVWDFSVPLLPVARPCSPQLHVHDCNQGGFLFRFLKYCTQVPDLNISTCLFQIWTARSQLLLLIMICGSVLWTRLVATFIDSDLPLCFRSLSVNHISRCGSYRRIGSGREIGTGIFSPSLDARYLYLLSV